MNLRTSKSLWWDLIQRTRKFERLRVDDSNAMIRQLIFEAFLSNHENRWVIDPGLLNFFGKQIVDEVLSRQITGGVDVLQLNLIKTMLTLTFIITQFFSGPCRRIRKEEYLFVFELFDVL